MRRAECDRFCLIVSQTCSFSASFASIGLDSQP